MKTKEEIIKNSLKANENYQVNSIIDQITEKLNKHVQKGSNSYKYVFWTGTYKIEKEMAKHVAKRLNAMGFYARVGFIKPKCSGNKKPTIIIMLDRPKYQPCIREEIVWKGFFILLALSLILSGLFSEGIL